MQPLLMEAIVVIFHGNFPGLGPLLALVRENYGEKVSLKLSWFLREIERKGDIREGESEGRGEWQWEVNETRRVLNFSKLLWWSKRGEKVLRFVKYEHCDVYLNITTRLPFISAVYLFFLFLFSIMSIGLHFKR